MYHRFRGWLKAQTSRDNDGIVVDSLTLHRDPRFEIFINANFRHRTTMESGAFGILFCDFKFVLQIIDCAVPRYNISFCDVQLFMVIQKNNKPLG